MANDKHKAKAISGEYAKTPKTGTAYVSVIFGCIEEDGKPKLGGDGEQLKYEYKGWMTDKAAQNTFVAIRRAGCTFPNSDPANLAGLGSKTVEIEIEVDDFGPKVKWVNEVRVGSVTDANKLGAGEKATFKMRFAGALNASKTGIVGAKSAPSASVAAWVPPVNDDSEPDETPEQIGADSDGSYLNETVAASGDAPEKFTLF